MSKVWEVYCCMPVLETCKLVKRIIYLFCVCKSVRTIQIPFLLYMQRQTIGCIPSSVRGKGILLVDVYDIDMFLC
jgi:hypothetical protein